MTTPKENERAKSADAEEEHRESGAPTDAAHEAAGDGTLQGSIPAGLTPEELLEIARSGPTDDGGAG